MRRLLLLPAAFAVAGRLEVHLYLVAAAVGIAVVAVLAKKDHPATRAALWTAFVPAGAWVALRPPWTGLVAVAIVLGGLFLVRPETDWRLGPRTAAGLVFGVATAGTASLLLVASDPDPLPIAAAALLLVMVRLMAATAHPMDAAAFLAAAALPHETGFLALVFVALELIAVPWLKVLGPEGATGWALGALVLPVAAF